jgi:hypothetical protein
LWPYKQVDANMVIKLLGRGDFAIGTLPVEAVRSKR